MHIQLIADFDADILPQKWWHFAHKNCLGDSPDFTDLDRFHIGDQ